MCSCGCDVPSYEILRACTRNVCMYGGQWKTSCLSSFLSCLRQGFFRALLLHTGVLASGILFSLPSSHERGGMLCLQRLHRPWRCVLGSSHLCSKHILPSKTSSLLPTIFLTWTYFGVFDLSDDSFLGYFIKQLPWNLGSRIFITEILHRTNTILWSKMCSFIAMEEETC